MTLFDIFAVVVDMSMKALITAIAALTCILPLSFIRRVPKRVSLFVMLIVVFRMICPVSFSAPFSVLNLDFLTVYGSHITPAALLESDPPVGEYEVAVSGSAEFEEALDAGLVPPVDRNLGFDYIEYVRDDNGSIAPVQTFTDVYGELAARIWLGGVIVFWGYGAVTYFLLKRRVGTATIIEDNVFETDRITVPFIMGFLRPRIYLPLGLSGEERKYVVCHEKMHIRWGDNVIKLIVYAAMSVHWFNLLLWLWFYRVFMMLMEQACDESVLRALGEDARADYSGTLLSLSSGRHFIGAIPVAFGEGFIKDRIHDILKYKKPAVFLTAVAIVFSAGVIAVCGTNGIVYDRSVISYEGDGRASGSKVFGFIPGEDVRSAAFTFEVWTEDGLYFSQRLASGSLNALDIEEENTITVSYVSNDWDSITMTFALNDSIYLNTDTVELPAGEYTGLGTSHIADADGGAYEAETDSVTALCAVIFTPGRLNASVGNCGVISAGGGEVEVEDGCAVALIKMETSSEYRTANLYHISSIVPWLGEAERCDVLSESKSAEVSPAEIVPYIRALASSRYFDFGSAAIDIDFEAAITLYHGNARAELYLDEYGYIYLSVTDGVEEQNLYKILPDQQSFGRLLAEIYDTLGIEYSAAGVYGLPQDIGDVSLFNGYEATLLAGFPQADVAVYALSGADECYFMMRESVQLYICTADYQPEVYGAIRSDYDGDGEYEVAFIGSAPPEDINDDFFFALDIDGGELILNAMYDFQAQLDMLISAGVYADYDNLISIDYSGENLTGGLDYAPDSVTVDISTYMTGSGEPSTDEVSVYSHENVDFRFEDSKMLFSTGIYLDFDDSGKRILCAVISGEVVYDGALVIGQCRLEAA